MLPDSPPYITVASPAQPVNASQTDAPVMVDDRTAYMLSSPPRDVVESEEEVVELALVEGFQNGRKHIPVPAPLDLHQDSVPATRAAHEDILHLPQQQCFRLGPSIQPPSGRIEEVSAPTDPSDGPFLLKRSTHYISRLPIRTMSSFETTQLRRDIALARMAKSTSPPVESGTSRPIPSLPLAMALENRLLPKTEDIRPTPSEGSCSNEAPNAAVESCPSEDMPGLDIRMTPLSTLSLTDVQSVPAIAGDSAAHIEPILDNGTGCPSPPNERQPVMTQNVMSLPSESSDDHLNALDSPACVAPAQLMPLDIPHSPMDASQPAALVAPPDSPLHHLISGTPDDSEPTPSLAALANADSAPMVTPTDEAPLAPVSSTPSAPLSAEEPQTTKTPLPPSSPSHGQLTLLSDDVLTVPVPTDEPACAATDESNLAVPPDPLDAISPSEPAASLTGLQSQGADGTGEPDNLSSGPPALSQPPAESPDCIQPFDNPNMPVDDASLAAANVSCSDLALVIYRPEAHSTPQILDAIIRADSPDYLVSISAQEAALPYDDAPTCLPASVPSNDLLGCDTSDAARIVSLAFQSRDRSPGQGAETEMDFQSANPVVSEDSTTFAAHDTAEDVTLEVDVADSKGLDVTDSDDFDVTEFTDFDVVETASDEGDIPAFADAELDLPPSSPPASSSPPHIFSSSPPREFLESPPSSSPPLLGVDESLPKEPEHEISIDVDVESQHLVFREPPKRSAAALATAEPANEDEERAAKRVKIEPSPVLADPPLPKRLTQASAAKQHKKLAAPFRSPVVKGPLVQGGLHAVYATGRALMPSPLRKAAADDVPVVSPREAASVRPDPTSANKDRTANAAKQFKSPLVASGVAAGPSASTSGATFSTVRAAPTIQALQGKLQTLKQAIRIKDSDKGDEEDELERLVAKWTTAGREVAWAVWDYVKDLAPESAAAAGPSAGGWSTDGGDFWGAKTGQKRGFEPGWGYDDDRAPKKVRMDEGVAEENGEEEEAQPVVQHTLGTMLRHMGIDPATLGWDEEEGDFVDV